MSKISLDEFIGKTIAGKFEVLERLGRGGMGAVYKARHLHLDRIIAVKILHSHLAQEEEHLVRFQREAKTACKIRHPNVITLHDYGVEDGFPYLAMEYIEGRTLKELMGEDSPLPLSRVYDIAVQICSALSEAHAIGVIHRDLKPDNVMVTARKDGSEWAQVLDFGISKVIQEEMSTELTQAGTVIGSPKYMAPEQSLGKGVDTRADLYSLGVLLYRMLSGVFPIQGSSAMETLVKVVHEAPKPLKDVVPNLKIDEGVSRCIMRLLEKDPDNRYQTADEFLTDLKPACDKALGRGASGKAVKLLALSAAIVFTAGVIYVSSLPHTPPSLEQEAESKEYLEELERLKAQKQKEIDELARIAKERREAAEAATSDAERRKALEQLELEQILELKEQAEIAASRAEEKRKAALAAAQRASQEKAASENAALLAKQEALAFREVRAAEQERAEEYASQAARATALAEQKRKESEEALAALEEKRRAAETQVADLTSDAESLRELREAEEKRAETLKAEALEAERLARSKQEEAEQAAKRARLNEQRAQDAEARAEELARKTPKATAVPTSDVSKAKSESVIRAKRRLEAQQQALEAERKKLEALRKKREKEAQRLEALRVAEQRRKEQEAAQQAEEEALAEEEPRRRMPRQGKRRF